MALSLVSLNIEGRKHFDTITPFLKQEQPDVFCVQELCKQDIPVFETVLQARGHFAPMSISSRFDDEIGVGIFTNLSSNVAIHRYAGHRGEILKSDPTSPETRYKTQQYVLLIAEITKEGQTFTIGTTHFPVTKEGAATDFQHEALAGFFRALESYEDIVFCGDFNAPRGREIFDAIAAKYTDNIPPQYTTSIDGSIHRAGPIPFVVDGLFSTEGYEVTSVAYHCGVSDHCAIRATVERK